MLKDPEFVTCPNPNCRMKIENLIIVSDVSTKPAERYYACPHCFIKLDVVSFRLLKEQADRRKEKRLLKPPEREKGYSKCGSYLGYLSTLPENEPIPRECLTCPKALDCAMKTSDSQ